MLSIFQSNVFYVQLMNLHNKKKPSFRIAGITRYSENKNSRTPRATLNSDYKLLKIFFFQLA